MISLLFAVAATLAVSLVFYAVLAAWSLHSLRVAREESRTGASGRIQFLELQTGVQRQLRLVH